MKEEIITDGNNLDGVVIRYQENKRHFLYFINNYLGNYEVQTLDSLAEQRNQPKLFARLTLIWNLLPDNIFNIENDPRGWKEFLEVIDFYEN